MPLKSAASLVIGAGVALLLSACASAAPVSAPETLPSVSAVPTPTAAAIPVPQPLLELGCNDLLSGEDAVALIGSEVSIVDPAETMAEAYPWVPYVYHVRQLGGLACEWSNGVPSSRVLGGPADYSGIRFNLLPDAAEQWEYFPIGEHVNCYVDPTTHCTADRLIGGTWWLSVELDSVDGSRTEEQVTAQLASVVEAITVGVTSAGKTDDDWSLPLSAIQPGAPCSSIVDDATVTQALESPFALTSRGSGGGGWSLEYGAYSLVGALPCFWDGNEGEAFAGSLTLLPGGAWAWEDAKAFNSPLGQREQLALQGLEQAESAWISCAGDNSTCSADIVVAGNWVLVQLWPNTEYHSFPADRRLAITIIAQAIADNTGVSP